MIINAFQRIASLLTVFLLFFLANGCAGGSDGNTASGNSEKRSPQGNNQMSDDSKIEILETKIKGDSAQGNMRMKNHLVISCKIKNKAEKTATIVSLKSIYFNEKEEQVAKGYGNANNLPPGETTKVDVRATKNIENPNNYEVKVLNANFK